MKSSKITLLWIIGITFPLSVLSANLDIKTPEISFFALKEEDTMPYYCHLDTVLCENQFYADVSAYSEFDSCHTGKSCLMASGKKAYIGAVACPREIKLGTQVEINGIVYNCEDRTARFVDGRYDIFMGYGESSYNEAINFGVKNLKITISK